MNIAAVYHFSVQSLGPVELFSAISIDHYIQRKALFLPSICQSENSLNNSLSRSAAAEMGPVKRIYEVHDAFREHGLHNTEPVKIGLHHSHILSTQHRVSLPRIEKVTEEL